MIRDLKVGIVGGSIAGCCAAILLARAGHRVTVFERSVKGLVGRGGGIGTSARVFESLQSDDLLDDDFPHHHISRLAFTACRTSWDRLGVSPWQMPMDFEAFQWSALWNNLRHRVPDGCYRRATEVTAVVANGPEGATLRFADETEDRFDLVLFADGYQSLGRATLFPDRTLSYRGYLLWRGLLPESALPESAPIDDAMVRLSYLGMPGDLVVYFVPHEDGSTRPGNRACNWAAYVPMREADLPAFMIDNEGRPRSGAIQPGGMRVEAEEQLKATVAPKLPAYFADIIRASTDTWVQLIYNLELPHHARGRIALIGDAGMVVQPFTGSGVFKGLNNVQDLLRTLESADDLDQAIDRWSTEQVRIGKGLLALADQMEDALIWNRLDFANADAATTEAWWRAAVKWPDEFSLEKG